ncbi:MAG: hypothetical protein KAT65_10760 [Methanophagales archaeon]|nr:hypothetical protein [Methanophagales archaeon]
MEPDIAGVLRQFESIKKHAKLIRQSIIRDIYSQHDPEEEVVSLVEDFKDAKTHFDMIKYKQKFDTYLRTINIPERIYKLETGEQKALLRKIDIECDKALGVLESIATPLSKDELRQTYCTQGGIGKVI